MAQTGACPQLETWTILFHSLLSSIDSLPELSVGLCWKHKCIPHFNLIATPEESGGLVITPILPNKKPRLKESKLWLQDQGHTASKCHSQELSLIQLGSEAPILTPQAVAPSLVGTIALAQQWLQDSHQYKLSCMWQRVTKWREVLRDGYRAESVSKAPGNRAQGLGAVVPPL